MNYLRWVVESILLNSAEPSRAEPTSRESGIFSGKGASLESFDITVIKTCLKKEKKMYKKASKNRIKVHHSLNA